MVTGIIRILSKYDKSIFTFSKNFIKVSIPFKKGKDIKLEIVKKRNIKVTNRQKQIIEIICDNKNINQEALSKKLGVSRYTIIRDLKDLEEKIISKELAQIKLVFGN